MSTTSFTIRDLYLLANASIDHDWASILGDHVVSTTSRSGQKTWCEPVASLQSAGFLPLNPLGQSAPGADPCRYCNLVYFIVNLERYAGDFVTGRTTTEAAKAALEKKFGASRSTDDLIAVCITANLDRVEGVQEAKNQMKLIESTIAMRDAPSTAPAVKEVPAPTVRSSRTGDSVWLADGAAGARRSAERVGTDAGPGKQNGLPAALQPARKRRAERMTDSDYLAVMPRAPPVVRPVASVDSSDDEFVIAEDEVDFQPDLERYPHHNRQSHQIGEVKISARVSNNPVLRSLVSAQDMDEATMAGFSSIGQYISFHYRDQEEFRLAADADMTGSWFFAAMSPVARKFDIAMLVRAMAMYLDSRTEGYSAAQHNAVLAPSLGYLPAGIWALQACVTQILKDTSAPEVGSVMIYRGDYTTNLAQTFRSLLKRPAKIAVWNVPHLHEMESQAFHPELPWGSGYRANRNGAWPPLASTCKHQVEEILSLYDYNNMKADPKPRLVRFSRELQLNNPATVVLRRLIGEVHFSIEDKARQVNVKLATAHDQEQGLRRANARPGKPAAGELLPAVQPVAGYSRY